MEKYKQIRERVGKDEMKETETGEVKRKEGENEARGIETKVDKKRRKKLNREASRE